MRVETASAEVSMLHERLHQMQEEGATASAAHAEELEKQRCAHAHEQRDAVALREDLRREHQRERVLQREVLDKLGKEQKAEVDTVRQGLHAELRRTLQEHTERLAKEGDKVEQVHLLKRQPSSGFI